MTYCTNVNTAIFARTRRAVRIAPDSCPKTAEYIYIYIIDYNLYYCKLRRTLRICKICQELSVDRLQDRRYNSTE